MNTLSFPKTDSPLSHLIPTVRLPCLVAQTTGFGVGTNDAKVKFGESIVVFGAGGVGLNIVQAASMTSAYPIIAVDLHDNRLALAKKMGATHLYNANTTDPFLEIKKLLGDSAIDVFVDNTGLPEIISKGYEITASNGRVILVGVPKANDKTLLNTLPLHFGKTISGSFGGDTVPDADIPRYMTLYNLGLMNLEALITRVVSLDDINDAIDAMRDGSIQGRVIVRMGRSS